MEVLTLADLWEAMAAAVPDRPVVVQGGRVTDWAGFDARADALAAYFIQAGLGRQAKVGAYLHNCAEYLETYFAAFKAGCAPFNVNYRYAADELHYLFENADAEAVVFHAGFSSLVEQLRPQLPAVKAWIAVAEPGQQSPAWAGDYDAIVATAPQRRPVAAPWGRASDDLMLLYTGGTTGLPKGVMWGQREILQQLSEVVGIDFGSPDASATVEARVADPGWRLAPRVVATPLMHGNGLFGAFTAMVRGAPVALLPSRRFDPVELWDEVERLGAEGITLVGMAFATPMLEALQAHPGRWDLTSVTAMNSSGAMWSQENKRALLTHCPNATIYDLFASSEAPGLGVSISRPGAEVQTAAFALGPQCAVITEDGRRVAPGSGERGLVAVGGLLPAGYYKDPEKTAKTFRIVDGVRWSFPGDWAEVNADGTLRLLGRGSVCINTGGEKVFPEEVEEALKTHPNVRDVVVVGVPDPRFGERICAVVEPRGSAPSLAELAAHLEGRLAGYKAPRLLVTVSNIGRGPNGKADYKAIRERALQLLAQPSNAAQSVAAAGKA